MAKTVDLRAYFEDDDWRRGDIWVSEGVLSCFVTLRLRGTLILRNHMAGANNSAITLLRSALRPHVAASSQTELEAQWPLLFCAGDLPNRCGVIADFSVSHVDGAVVMHDFLHCEVASDFVVSVPRRAWLNAVLSFGQSVARRLPATKRGVKSRRQPTYRRYRRLLKKEITAAKGIRRGV